MAVAERKATVILEGDLRLGTGTIQGDSVTHGQLPVSITERLAPDSGKMTPEELIASAHAADYALTLASALSAHGNQPDRLDVTAHCEIDRTPDGLAVTRMVLDVKGVVPRFEAAKFVEMAQKAEEKCLVSNAMRGNVEIELNAELVDAE